METPSLHGDGLLRALSEVALEVQKARTVGELLPVAGAGLEAMGFRVLVTDFDGDSAGLVYATEEPSFGALLRAFGLVPGRRLPQSRASLLLKVSRDERSAYVEDVRALARATLTAVPGEVLERSLEGLPSPLPMVVAPLNVRRAPWGALTLLHPALHRDDLDLLNLFALQLGSAIEIAGALESLAQRTAELELVYQLTNSGPKADTSALTTRALEVVCRSTRSDAGALYRYDEGRREYLLVGEPFGTRGALLDAYRKLPDRLDARLTARPDEPGFSQVAAIPLSIEGTRVGVLWLGRRGPDAYAAGELHSAEILGVQMASFLERIRLYDDLKRSYDELGRAQSELVRHERLAALGELAAVVAHEVRNPLGVIFNSLLTLKRLIKPQGDVELLLTMVGEEAERLNRIVSDLLDFVRPYEVTRLPVAVGPIVDGALDATVKLAEQASVRVSRQVPDELPPFPVDAQLLRQALVNLLVNAVQAMPRGGTLEVRAAVEPRAAGPWLVLSVRDEGVGLSPGAGERIFQPFFTTKATGTGLGLAVVKRIVDAHQGEIQATPNQDGPGATFTLKLPGG